MQVQGCANKHMQGGGKEKHHSPPSRGSEQLHGRASLSTRSSGRRGPRVGLGESGVAEKLAAVLIGGETVEPVGGGAPGCQAQAFLPPAENCCCLFSFFSFFLRERGKPGTKDYRAFGPAQAQSGPTLSRN